MFAAKMTKKRKEEQRKTKKRCLCNHIDTAGPTALVPSQLLAGSPLLSVQ
jgi:hypothetical protein